MPVGEDLAHALAPDHGRPRDLALWMLPRRDAQLDLVHRLEGDHVGRPVAVLGEPGLLLFLAPDFFSHWNPRLDGCHVLAPPSLRHIGFIRRSLENAPSFATALETRIRRVAALGCRKNVATTVQNVGRPPRLAGSTDSGGRNLTAPLRKLAIWAVVPLSRAARKRGGEG